MLLAIDGFREAVPPARSRFIALFEGSEPVVERATRELRSAFGAAGSPRRACSTVPTRRARFQSLLDAYAGAESDDSVTFVARGLPADAALRAQRVRAVLPRAETIADLRTGDVIVRVRDNAAAVAKDPAVPSIERVVRRLLGHATVLCAGASVRVDAWGEPPPTIATMRELKARFDPRATLAPGRFVGGI